MNIYITITTRKDWQNKDGSKSIYLRLTINRKVSYISLKIKVLPNCWNEKNTTVLKKDSHFLQKNNLIRKYKSKAESIIYNHILQDKHLSISEFKKHFFNNTYGTNSFYEFIESDLKKSEKTLSSETLKGYKSQLNKLKAFKPQLNFTDIDFAFIRSYEVAMLERNNRNTVNKALTFIKTFINRAIKQNVYKDINPFNNYPISRVQGVRAYLTKEELKKLEDLLRSGNLKPNKENVLRYFLFCCYTGLRYTDIKNLKFKNIKTDMYIDNYGTKKNINVLEVIMHKTKRLVKIPIIPEAEKLIQYPKVFSKEMNVFYVMTSQPTNRYLKELAKQSNIEKTLSFHVSRHTLATNSLEHGIPIEVVSQILGHKDLRTTQIYAKVSNKLKIKEMMKMQN